MHKRPEQEVKVEVESKGGVGRTKARGRERGVWIHPHRPLDTADDWAASV